MHRFLVAFTQIDGMTWRVIRISDVDIGESRQPCSQRSAFGHVVLAVCAVALPGGRGVVFVALRLLPLAVCSVALLGFLLVSRAWFRPPCGLCRCSTGRGFVVAGR